MSGLWTPQGSGTSAIEIDDSQVELHDSDFLKIEKGPLAYARERAHSSMEIDAFVRAMSHEFYQIGLVVDVQPWTTQQEGTYIFKCVIVKRLTEFDPDRQVHEVVSNILEIPGEGGWINTKNAMQDRDKSRGDNGRHKH
jgi:hypothetical protein